VTFHAVGCIRHEENPRKVYYLKKHLVINTDAQLEASLKKAFTSLGLSM
jgi:hypothetical protein